MSGCPNDVALMQAMFDQAEAFSRLAIKAFEDLKRADTIPAFAFAPFVVNLTFSIELYLKTLGRLHSVILKRRDHKLLPLYEGLPPVARAAIAAKALAPEATVTHQLESLNDAFVQWRYLYEPSDQSRTVSPQSAIWTAGVLREACLDGGWLLDRSARI